MRYRSIIALGALVACVAMAPAMMTPGDLAPDKIYASLDLYTPPDIIPAISGDEWLLVEPWVREARTACIKNQPPCVAQLRPTIEPTIDPYIYRGRDVDRRPRSTRI